LAVLTSRRVLVANTDLVLVAARPHGPPQAQAEAFSSPSPRVLSVAWLAGVVVCLRQDGGVDYLTPFGQGDGSGGESAVRRRKGEACAWAPPPVRPLLSLSPAHALLGAGGACLAAVLPDRLLFLANPARQPTLYNPGGGGLGKAGRAGTWAASRLYTRPLFPLEPLVVALAANAQQDDRRWALFEGALEKSSAWAEAAAEAVMAAVQAVKVRRRRLVASARCAVARHAPARRWAPGSAAALREVGEGPGNSMGASRLALEALRSGLSEPTLALAVAGVDLVKEVGQSTASSAGSAAAAAPSTRPGAFPRTGSLEEEEEEEERVAAYVASVRARADERFVPRPWLGAWERAQSCAEAGRWTEALVECVGDGTEADAAPLKAWLLDHARPVFRLLQASNDAAAMAAGEEKAGERGLLFLQGLPAGLPTGRALPAKGSACSSRLALLGLAARRAEALKAAELALALAQDPRGMPQEMIGAKDASSTPSTNRALSPSNSQSSALFTALKKQRPHGAKRPCELASEEARASARWAT